MYLYLKVFDNLSEIIFFCLVVNKVNSVPDTEMSKSMVEPVFLW